MKKLTYTAFVAFWSCVATLLAVAVLAPDARVDAQVDAREELPVYSLDDVAEHASADSCWVAIEGRVYDLTEYIPMHPTPPDVVLQWCGREATEGMRTKGYGRDHSAAAWAMLDDYVIGTMEQ